MAGQRVDKPWERGDSVPSEGCVEGGGFSPLLWTGRPLEVEGKPPLRRIRAT